MKFLKYRGKATQMGEEWVALPLSGTTTYRSYV